VASDGVLLSAIGMHKHFGGVHALRGADLEVRRAEVHSLVGANGSGKSTLLNILSGQVAPDGGTITFDGAPISFRDPTRALAAGIATVTQETTLVPELSVPSSPSTIRSPACRPTSSSWSRSRAHSR
jgi:ABC-type sugar transport system ATPase subunit